MGTKQFLIAGVDFVISKNEPYFLEANSSPGSFAMKLLDGRPLEVFGKLVKKRFSPKVVASLYSTRDASDSIRLNILENFFEVHACNVNEQNFQSKFLVDDEGMRFEPDLIIFNRLRFSQFYEGGAPRINSDSVIRITLDKHLSTEIVEHAGVSVPETYFSLSSSIAKQILEISNLKDYVIKGNFGQAGAGILFSGGGELSPIRGVKLIQEKIKVDKMMGAKFWDVRAILVDGKFQGATIRYSDSPAVNLHLGGKMELALPEIESLVKAPAEKAVRAIDKVASAIESLPPPARGRSP